MKPPIPDYTDAEQRHVEALLQRRYGAPVAIELADSELLLDPAANTTISSPAC